MSTSTITILVLCIILILMYNSLIAKKNQVDNIYATIDAQLKKRYDLIPNLVATVAEYMEHEKDILQELTQLRSQALQTTSTQEQNIQLDTQLTPKLSALMVAVENYPDLKANQNMLNLQKTLHETEAQIAAARRAYNQAVTDYNNALEQIPTNFIASLLHYQPKQLFEIPKEQRNNIDIKKLFNQS